jgi:hypothetical protein
VGRFDVRLRADPDERAGTRDQSDRDCPRHATDSIHAAMMVRRGAERKLD